MITVTIYRKPENQFKGFQVIGHAGSTEEGADLVCCSVSVLTITDDEFELIQQEELGLVQLTFKEAAISEKAALLMQSFDLGVHSVAEEYDTWLKVITKEV